MKLAFFLVGFCLIFLRVFYDAEWSGDKNRNRVTITISIDDDYEQIKYLGRIVLTEDETGIARIAPGGYIKYRHNDWRLRAESDLQGNITYDIRNDGDPLTAEGKGKEVIKEALREMILHGFDARERMLRVYNSGGDSALAREMGLMKEAGLSHMYREFLASHQHNKEDSLKIMNAPQ